MRREELEGGEGSEVSLSAGKQEEVEPLQKQGENQEESEEPRENDCSPREPIPGLLDRD